MKRPERSRPGGSSAAFFSDALHTRSSNLPPVNYGPINSPSRCLGWLALLLLLACAWISVLPSSSHLLGTGFSKGAEYYWKHSWLGVSKSPPDPIDQQIVLFKLALPFAWLTLPALTSVALNKGARKLRPYLFLIAKLLLVVPTVFLTVLTVSALCFGPLDRFLQLVFTVTGFLLS